MRIRTALACLLACAVLPANAEVFINELHYDNAGADSGEAVEIVATAGESLSGYRVWLYNGSSAPANAQTYEDNAAALVAEIEGLEATLADLKAAHEGDRIFVTEPVPLYLTAAAGLENATPAAFSEAVEEGQDVPPATLLEAVRILTSGEVRVLIVNAQTGGAETDEVVARAKGAGIPVLEFTELVPDGDTYLTWMQANVAALADTLAR